MQNSTLKSLNILRDKAEELIPLVHQLKEATTLKSKIEILCSYLQTAGLLTEIKRQFPHLLSFSPSSQVVILSLFAIRQGAHIFPSGSSFAREDEKHLKELLDTLQSIEEFYHPLGGIAGYHFVFLQLMVELETLCQFNSSKYKRPPGQDLTQDTPSIRKAVRSGIERLHEIGEIYPVAGAGDRLDLKDETTGTPLPAAELAFLGHTLLEGLIRDLEGREYLYFKLFNKSITTPLVLMTSLEKNNDAHIQAILEKKMWFKRNKEHFFFIRQPLAPVIGDDGMWVLSEPFHLFLKPGGHGTIWKLAHEKGAFAWLQNQDREKVIVRQINNPVAGTDHGLLAIAGIGCKEKKLFGFASCERLVHNAEGMDVLIERKTNQHYEYVITNVEYTDFEKLGIHDVPESSSSPFSKFPANTNILFADLKAVAKAIKKSPLPGMTINMKNFDIQVKGKTRKVTAGRLESTMQNIADLFTTETDHLLSEEEKQNLPTFVTYNARNKTISVTKKKHTEGSSIQETPQGAFYTILSNHEELLKLCGFDLPKLPTPDEFIQYGPSFFFSYHPALGPLYSVIVQKLHAGRLKMGSELKLEISEILIESLEIEGSLLIIADQPTGRGAANFSDHSGKCILKNVKVENKGLDRNSKLNYWKKSPVHLESVLIQIEGNGEFFAENICLKGSFKFVVPHEHKMRVVQEGAEIKTYLEKITVPSWKWTYQFDSDDYIHLTSL